MQLIKDSGLVPLMYLDNTKNEMVHVMRNSTEPEYLCQTSYSLLLPNKRFVGCTNRCYISGIGMCTPPAGVHISYNPSNGRLETFRQMS